jgi:hypothetical protein
MFEEFHKTRLFDMAAGLGADLAAVVDIINARSLTIIQRAEENFRRVIDGNTPTVYVIDLQTQVIDPIKKAYTITDPTFTTEMTKALGNVGFTLSTAEFQESIQKSYNKVQNSLVEFKKPDSGATHLDYRNVFLELGKELKQVFTSTTSKQNIIRITDPEAMGQEGKLVFIGKSFTLVRTNVNKAINDVLRRYSKSGGSYGEIMAAGHTSVRLGIDPAGDSVYGINTPASQKALFLLEAYGHENNIATRVNQADFQNQFVKKVSLFVNNTLNFNENFTPTAQTLLEFNFTFIVPMDTVLNSTSGAFEDAAIKQLVGGTVLPGLANAMKSRLAYIAKNFARFKASPTLLEYIASLIANTLQDKVTNNIIKSETEKSATKLSLLIPDSKAILNSASKPLGSKQQKLASSSIRTQGGQFYSLASLQQLINSLLVKTIKENMGTGNRRDVLNLRSGRFAESAEVKRMTQSREGTITAFYSYMRNPYGTFSEGGRQEYPRSRDPKLLISKSIREIAELQVKNRLRAVLV